MVHFRQEEFYWAKKHSWVPQEGNYPEIIVC